MPSLPPGVVITSAENLEYVFKNESLITKGPFFKERSWDLFGMSTTACEYQLYSDQTNVGYGIINASGELWRAQRKAGLKFFGGASLDTLVEDVLPAAFHKARIQLLRLCETNEHTDLQRFFLDLTTSVVGQMAYDASCPTFDLPRSAH